MPSTLRTLTAPPAVLDVEASGFGRHSYPIEIGYILSDGRSFCALVRPEPEWTHWDAAAEDLHHISRALLCARGMAAAELAQRLNAALLGQTVYSDGWANDYSWLGALFEAAHLLPSFRLESLRALLDEDDAAQWHTVKNRVACQHPMQRHRASADARLLQLTLESLRLQAGGQ